MSLETNDKWGALVVTGTGQFVERKRQLTSAIHETFPDRQIDLRCRCGKEFHMWERDFPGKRKLKDCGCRIGEKLGRPRDKLVERSTISFSLAVYLQQWLIERAREENLSRSRTLERILEEVIESRAVDPVRKKTSRRG